MKPIQLTLKGLHSFREKQTIHFDDLCEGGVFGIFGPTGSGKSSLLDAMTLALYGKVERAANNTNGILNSAEDTLAVSFSFQLGYGDRTKRYEVERTFKRSGETTIKTATCRFIDITSEPVVLAEKAGDVTKAVEDLLGLSIDDFTRAVVLPQGKFSEFLALKGTERRQMLQRLFHLEKYGDDLTRKLRSRLTSTKHDKELVEKEQLGLGNASEEVLHETENKLEELTRQLEDEKKKHMVLEEESEQIKTIRAWQIEKDSTEKSMGKLEKVEDEIRLLESQVKLAKEAAILSPYAAEMEESVKAVEEWSKDVDKLSTNMHDIKLSKETNETAFLSIKKQKEEEESPLRLKIEELKQIKAKQVELKSEEVKISSLEQVFDSLGNQMEEAKETKEKSIEDRVRYEKAQNDLKDKLQGWIVPSNIRKEIYAAVESKREVTHISSKVAEVEQQQNDIKIKKEIAETAVNDKVKQLEKKKIILKERFYQLYQWYDRLANEERELQSFSRTLKLKKEDIDKNNRFNLAHQLRKQLIEGENCPVCGSVHHPFTSEAPPSETVSEDSELTWIMEALDEVPKLERELEKGKWTLNDYSSKMKEFIDSEEVASASIEEEEDQNITKLLLKDGESLQAYWSTRKQKTKKEMEAIYQTIEKVNKDVNDFHNMRDEWKEHTMTFKGLENSLNEFDSNFKTSKETLDNAIEEWKQQFSDLDYDSINEKWNDIQKKDEEASILRERIDKSVPIIEDKQKQVEKSIQSLHDLSIKKSTIETEIHQRKREWDNKVSKIIASIGNANVEELIDKSTHKLKELLSQFNETESTYQKSLSELQELDKKHTISLESLKHARDRLTRSEDNWNKQLSKTIFNSIEEVKNASLYEDNISEKERVVSKHDEQKRELKSHYEKYIKLLDGRTVSEEEVQKSVVIVQISRDSIEQLGTERGGILSAVKEIKKRVARYEVLEKNRQELEEKYNELIKLDQVFRGKAFVEFIAEEQLIQVSRLASDRLHSLTRGRYAIEVDSAGGFIIRDDANGGVKRPVSTLSGGETFLTSLALALSLSASIQLKGEHPLEFFFLDEGFGTLDQELLEIVISALEKLHTDALSVGIISHVPELRERLPRKLIVTPAEAGGKGSTVSMESM